jgi:aspartyl-tRNA synthetase
MVGGMDKYFQIVKCFREDLRADRQPEFTKLIVKWLLWNKKILNVFELTRHLLKEIKGIEVDKACMTYEHAMKTYGNDKPDILEWSLEN